MKKMIKYIVLAVATMFAVGCTPDYPTLDESKLPLASELEVEIVVDQTTNMVTFTLKNEGMVPLWIFPEAGKPDDSAAKKAFSMAINGYTARFRDAGTYSVEVKAYNANGVSQGSVNKEFTLENTYRDPFDQTKYLNAVAGEWMWNSTVDHHMGCGGSLENPLEWWDATAGEKEGVGLYDDRMTFTADGKYTFNPGEGGQVYVNWGNNEVYPGWSGVENDDYAVDWEEFTTGYHFENNWNDAGIEEIYLVLDEGANLSYIPSQENLQNPRYQVMESKPADMRKKLHLIWSGTGIVWKYEFVPAVKVVTPEELLAGTNAAGKVWVMDSAAPGHLACGPDATNPAGWWSAGPEEKAGTGLYDNELTFCPDGTYKFNPGADGNIYVHTSIKADSGIPGTSDNGQDYDMAWSAQEGTYTFENNILTLPEGFTVGYLSYLSNYFTPSWTVTELTEKTLKLVAYTDAETDNGGVAIAWQLIFRARDFKEPEASIGGVAFEGGKAELDIAQGDVLAVTGIDLSTIYVDPDFFKQVDATSLKFLAMDGEYRIQKFDNWLKVIPLEGGDKATYEYGKAIWVIGDGGGKPEGGEIGWATGEAPLPLARISENQYRITLWMKAEGGSIKLYERPEWGDDNTGAYLWLQNRYGTITDNGYFNIPEANGNIKTMAGTTPGFYTFFFTDNDGILDMEVKKPAQKPESLDATAESNLWTGATKTETTWFAGAGSWDQIADPVVEKNGSDYSVTLPEGIGPEQWKGQMAITTDIVTEEGKNYDFQVKLYSEQAHPHVTVKLCNGAEGAKDDPYYFDPKIELLEDETATVLYWNIDGKACNPVKLVLDFGGGVGGQVIEVTDIVLQEHNEWE